jgi:hypothetical protein
MQLLNEEAASIVRELDQGARIEPGELQAYVADVLYAGCETRVLVVK